MFDLKIFVVVANETFRPQAMALVQEMRNWNSVDYPMQPMKVGKQFQLAEERDCHVAIIVDQQIEQRAVEVKVLSTREQTKVSLNDSGLLQFLGDLEFDLTKRSIDSPTAAGQPPA